MKRYNEFLNELKASTYLSAADKLENNSPKLSKRFKEHGEKIELKEFLDNLYHTDLLYWLTCAPKEDILAKRDKSKIHPILLEIEEGGYLMDDSIFWDGAGMNKKNMYYQDRDVDDNILYIDLFDDINGAITFDWFDYGVMDMLDNPKNIDKEYIDKNIKSFNKVGYFRMNTLPRRLAKQFFNSSFFKPSNGETWHILWNEEN